MNPAKHWLVIAFLLSGISASWGDDLRSLTLSEILQLDVVSASQQPESFQRMAAAGTIITNRELENSAALNVMDALRLVPNAHIFNQSNQRYVLGLRGFETNNLNQTLVLKDGRSLNIPTLTGIYWHEVNYPTDEIEQIEVIRGPSASHWGSNAANGVINIISKHARKTQGEKAVVGFGNELSQMYYFRHGGHFENSNVYYRASLGYEEIDDSGSSGGVDFNDGAYSLKTALRLDGESDDGDTVYSLSFEALAQEFNEKLLLFDDATSTSDFEALENDSEGGSIVGSLNHYISHEEVIRFRSYFEYYDRNLGALSQIQTNVTNFQVEYEHRPFEKHLMHWALEYRYIHEQLDADSDFTFRFNNSESERHLLTLGFEDHIELIEDTFFVMPAAKVEFHNQTDTEYLGSLKAKWLPSNRQTYWASIARAVRTPSLAEREMLASLPGGATPLVLVQPNRELDSEESLSYELGGRFLISDDVFLETNLFYTEHQNLINAEFEGVALPALLTRWNNNREGTSRGAEVSLEYRPYEILRLRARAGYMKLDLDGVAVGSVETVRARTDERLLSNLSAEFTPEGPLSAMLVARYVSDIETNSSGVAYPDYWDMDAQLNYAISDTMTLSIIGRNLFREQREEYRFTFTQFESTPVNRSVFLRLKVDF